jgi:hypothetical protein
MRDEPVPGFAVVDLTSVDACEPSLGGSTRSPA